MIHAKNICHQRFEKLIPEKPISFCVHQGDVLRFVGNNGVRKTTLFRILMGELAYRGELHFNWPDQSACVSYLALLMHRKIPQNITIRQYISWMSALYGIRQEGFEQVLHDLGVAVAQRRIGQLSQGFQVRLQLALLSLVSAHVWYLDEPWVHLDQDTGNLLNDWINLHIDRGGCVVVSSHQMPDGLNKVRECML